MHHPGNPGASVPAGVRARPVTGASAAALETPGDALRVDGTRPVAELVTMIRAALGCGSL